VNLFFLYANRFPEGRAREKSLYRAYVILRDSIGNSVQAHKALAYLMREYPDTLLPQQSIPQAQKKAELQPQAQPQIGDKLFVPT